MLNADTPTDGEALSAEWKTAKTFLLPLGPSSNTFTHCVRALRQDIEEHGALNAQQLRPRTLNQFKRLYKSPTFQAMFYYALRTCCEEDLQKIPSLTPEWVIDLLGPETASSMIALCVMFRRTRHCSPREKFLKIAQPMQSYVDLGLYMGKAIPELGTSAGVLSGGLRYIAFALFARADDKLFKDYRMHLKRKNLAFDLAFESTQFGCTHLHLGSLLLQTYGFGITDAHAYQEGMTSKSAKLDRKALRYKIAATWLDSLMLYGHAPESDLGDEFLVSDLALDKLEGQIPG
jgi:hypothetical protein